MIKDNEEYFEHVAARLTSKTWEELEVIETSFGDKETETLLFPVTLLRRKPTGKFEETKLVALVPRSQHMRKARVMARAWAAKEDVDVSLDPDLLEEMEGYCILSQALRSPTPPYEPYEEDPKRIETKWDKESIFDVIAQIEANRVLINPRPEQIGQEQIIALVSAISESRSVAPLHVYDSDAQASYIITTAELLASLLVSKSSLESSEPSTAAN